jgi:hypothetical protein
MEALTHDEDPIKALGWAINRMHMWDAFSGVWCLGGNTRLAASMSTMTTLLLDLEFSGK